MNDPLAATLLKSPPKRTAPPIFTVHKTELILVILLSAPYWSAWRMGGKTRTICPKRSARPASNCFFDIDRVWRTRNNDRWHTTTAAYDYLHLLGTTHPQLRREAVALSASPICFRPPRGTCKLVSILFRGENRSGNQRWEILFKVSSGCYHDYWLCGAARDENGKSRRTNMAVTDGCETRWD